MLVLQEEVKVVNAQINEMPSVHGEDAVIRILDKESISEQFTELRLDILGFPEQELRRFVSQIVGLIQNQDKLLAPFCEVHER